MAEDVELSASVVREYFVKNGGKVKRHDLFDHFRSQLDNTSDEGKLKNQFGDIVNSLAFLQNIEGEKYFVLNKSRNGTTPVQSRRPMRAGNQRKEKGVSLPVSIRNFRFSSTDDSPGGFAENRTRSISNPRTKLMIKSDSLPNAYLLKRDGSESSIPEVGPDNDSGVDTGLSSLQSESPRGSRHGSLPRNNEPDRLSQHSGDTGFFGEDEQYDHDIPSHVLTGFEKSWMMSSMVGNKAEIVCHLDQDPSIVFFKDFIMGYTALHWAAKQGSEDIVRLLLLGGANVNAKSNGGYTALHLASIHGRINIINILIDEYHVDVHVRDHSGKEAKDVLKAKSSDAIKQKLRDPVAVIDTVHHRGFTKPESPRLRQKLRSGASFRFLKKQKKFKGHDRPVIEHWDSNRQERLQSTLGNDEKELYQMQRANSGSLFPTSFYFGRRGSSSAVSKADEVEGAVELSNQREMLKSSSYPRFHDAATDDTRGQADKPSYDAPQCTVRQLADDLEQKRSHSAENLASLAPPFRGENSLYRTLPPQLRERPYSMASTSDQSGAKITQQRPYSMTSNTDVSKYGANVQQRPYSMASTNDQGSVKIQQQRPYSMASTSDQSSAKITQQRPYSMTSNTDVSKYGAKKNVTKQPQQRAQSSMVTTNEDNVAKQPQKTPYDAVITIDKDLSQQLKNVEENAGEEQKLLGRAEQKPPPSLNSSVNKYEPRHGTYKVERSVDKTKRREAENRVVNTSYEGVQVNEDKEFTGDPFFGDELATFMTIPKKPVDVEWRSESGSMRGRKDVLKSENKQSNQRNVSAEVERLEKLPSDTTTVTAESSRDFVYEDEYLTALTISKTQQQDVSRPGHEDLYKTNSKYESEPLSNVSTTSDYEKPVRPPRKKDKQRQSSVDQRQDDSEFRVPHNLTSQKYSDDTKQEHRRASMPTFSESHHNPQFSQHGPKNFDFRSGERRQSDGYYPRQNAWDYPRQKEVSLDHLRQIGSGDILPARTDMVPEARVAPPYRPRSSEGMTRKGKGMPRPNYPPPNIPKFPPPNMPSTTNQPLPATVGSREPFDDKPPATKPDNERLPSGQQICDIPPPSNYPPPNLPTYNLPPNIPNPPPNLPTNNPVAHESGLQQLPEQRRHPQYLSGYSYPSEDLADDGRTREARDQQELSDILYQREPWEQQEPYQPGYSSQPGSNIAPYDRETQEPWNQQEALPYQHGYPSQNLPNSGIPPSQGIVDRRRTVPGQLEQSQNLMESRRRSTNSTDQVTSLMTKYGVYKSPADQRPAQEYVDFPVDKYFSRAPEMISYPLNRPYDRSRHNPNYGRMEDEQMRRFSEGDNRHCQSDDREHEQEIAADLRWQSDDRQYEIDTRVPRWEDDAKFVESNWEENTDEVSGYIVDNPNYDQEIIHKRDSESGFVETNLGRHEESSGYIVASPGHHHQELATVMVPDWDQQVESHFIRSNIDEDSSGYIAAADPGYGQEILPRRHETESNFVESHIERDREPSGYITSTYNQELAAVMVPRWDQQVESDFVKSRSNVDEKPSGYIVASPEYDQQMVTPWDEAKSSFVESEANVERNREPSGYIGSKHDQELATVMVPRWDQQVESDFVRSRSNVDDEPSGYIVAGPKYDQEMVTRSDRLSTLERNDEPSNYIVARPDQVSHWDPQSPYWDPEPEQQSYIVAKQVSGRDLNETEEQSDDSDLLNNFLGEDVSNKWFSDNSVKETTPTENMPKYRMTSLI